MKTAAFKRKQEELKDFCYDDVGPLTTLLARVLGVAPGLGYACLSIGGPLKKRMSDAHLSCLAAISKVF